MTKQELIAEMSIASGLSQKDTASALKAFQEVVAKELSGGNKVQLVGFGSFEVLKRAERAGKNPKTGDLLIIPSTLVPKFRAGKDLKARIKA